MHAKQHELHGHHLTPTIFVLHPDNQATTGTQERHPPLLWHGLARQQTIEASKGKKKQQAMSPEGSVSPILARAVAQLRKHKTTATTKHMSAYYVR